MMVDLASVFEQLLAVLDRFEIRYCVGGSVASSSYGMPRQTNDIDILADFSGVDLGELSRVLSPDFYADSESIREAVRSGRPFNVIHLKGAFKFDFFPAVPGREFEQSELTRRKQIVSRVPGLEGIEFAVVTAEDALLAKLLWFRQGGEISERQWHDIRGILKVQADRLDLPYLRSWAKRLGISDLLERSLAN